MTFGFNKKNIQREKVNGERETKRNKATTKFLNAKMQNVVVSKYME